MTRPPQKRRFPKTYTEPSLVLEKRHPGASNTHTLRATIQLPLSEITTTKANQPIETPPPAHRARVFARRLRTHAYAKNQIPRGRYSHTNGRARREKRQEQNSRTTPSGGMTSDEKHTPKVGLANHNKRTGVMAVTGADTITLHDAQSLLCR